MVWGTLRFGWARLAKASPFLVCALLAGAPAAAQSEGGFPPKATIVFTGNYAVELQKKRQSRSKDMGQILFGGPSQLLEGTLRLDMQVEGEALRARVTGTGGVRADSMTGTVRKGICRLTDSRQTVVYEGPCGRRGFDGSISSTDANSNIVKGRFRTTMQSLTDGAEVDRQRQIAVQQTREDKQTDKVYAARYFLGLKSRAEAGETVAMRELADAYDEGVGTGRDKAAAELWWGRAAAKGDGWSGYQLASVALERGLNSEDVAEVRRARTLFERCATANPASFPELKNGVPGQALCEERAGTIAMVGFKTLPADVPAARRWFQSCSNRGFASCREKLAKLNSK